MYTSVIGLFPPIMDRNLGAMDIYYHGDSHYGDLYYQFGRKDPFSGPRGIYILKGDGSYSFETWSTSAYSIPNTTVDTNCNNVPYSIQHPLVFIKGTYWTYNDTYNPTLYDSSIRWQDPYVKDDTGKSMFDPCPTGWKTPKKGTWDGFTPSNFIWNNPLSIGRNEPNSSAFYPTSGRLLAGTGMFQYVGNTGEFWCCNSSGDSSVYLFSFSVGYVNPSYNYNTGRANGFPLRCIQE